jgi:hypothetical protein
MPGENILFSSPKSIEYLGDHYELYITDMRLLWFKRSGLVFKKDKIISENIGDILEMRYEEKGIISKKGMIKVVTGRKELEFSGRRDVIKTIHSELQAQMAQKDEY